MHACLCLFLATLKWWRRGIYGSVTDSVRREKREREKNTKLDWLHEEKEKELRKRKGRERKRERNEISQSK